MTPEVQPELQTEDKGPSTKRVKDPEIQALARLDEIMSELTFEQGERVIKWLDHKYIFSRKYEGESRPGPTNDMPPWVE